MAGAAGIVSQDDYIGLTEWVRIIGRVSENGKNLIRNFNQVPSNIYNVFQNAVSITSLELKGLDTEGRLAMRDIVVRNTPNLIENFDYHFKGFFNA